MPICPVIVYACYHNLLLPRARPHKLGEAVLTL
jgi:hypothetical protein